MAFSEEAATFKNQLKKIEKLKFLTFSRKMALGGAGAALDGLWAALGSSWESLGDAFGEHWAFLEVFHGGPWSPW